MRICASAAHGQQRPLPLDPLRETDDEDAGPDRHHRVANSQRQVQPRHRVRAVTHTRNGSPMTYDCAVRTGATPTKPPRTRPRTSKPASAARTGPCMFAYPRG